MIALERGRRPHGHGRSRCWRMALGLLLAVFLLPAAAVDGAAPAGRAAAANAETLAQVQRRIAQAPLLRGEFEQEKRVQGFKNPLRSSGRFLIAREHGVLWTTLKPFPSEMVLTRDRILNRRADGGLRVEADARQQPALRQVNAMMFALMSGDVKALSAHFDVQPELRPAMAWRLVLVPRAAAMAQVFGRITLEGDRYVRQVEIDERSGDRTLLRFANMTETPANLTADEARRFD